VRRSIAAKFRDAVREIGLRDACLLAFGRALIALTRGRARLVKYYFMAQPAAPKGLRAPSGGRFAFSWVDGTCPLLSQADRPAAVIADRFAQGARCLLATTSDSRFAGFLWYVAGPYDEDEVRVRYRPLPQRSTAWDFDVSIMPEHRMSRLFGYLWQRAGVALAEQGVTHTISRISAFNPGSLAAHRRLGGTLVGHATFLRIGRWQWMRASMPPHWHLSWRDDQRPLLSPSVDARTIT
jgi:hypothetical protein